MSLLQERDPEYIENHGSPTSCLPLTDKAVVFISYLCVSLSDSSEILKDNG